MAHGSFFYAVKAVVCTYVCEEFCCSVFLSVCSVVHYAHYCSYIATLHAMNSLTSTKLLPTYILFFCGIAGYLHRLLKAFRKKIRGDKYKILQI